jgi:hypothetical protein
LHPEVLSGQSAHDIIMIFKIAVFENVWEVVNAINKFPKYVTMYPKGIIQQLQQLSKKNLQAVFLMVQVQSIAFLFRFINQITHIAVLLDATKVSSISGASINLSSTVDHL